jgi:hypothetical protein
VELGCGAGDVSGPYAQGDVFAFPRGYLDTGAIEVVGVDVVPIAKEKCEERWPGMKFILAPAETLTPMDCDILVMTEFLEHVADPLSLARLWMPHAKWAVIGHPMDEPDPPYEYGHAWSYSEEDWRQWFALAPMPIWEMFKFPMGYYENMIMGHGGHPE